MKKKSKGFTVKLWLAFYLLAAILHALALTRLVLDYPRIPKDVEDFNEKLINYLHDDNQEQSLQWLTWGHRNVTGMRNSPLTITTNRTIDKVMIKLKGLKIWTKNSNDAANKEESFQETMIKEQLRIRFFLKFKCYRHAQVSS